MRSAVPSPLAVCAVWESLSDFQLCEGLNRPSVPTVLSGIVAPRVFLPSNSHQYFASALTYCSLSPCLDSFIRSPERRGNRPTILSGVVAPRVFLPSNSHHYLATALKCCYLSPYLDRFAQSPERRGKPTKNCVRSCSSSCVPSPPPPLTTPTVLCICSNLSFSVALSWSVNIRSFSFVLTVEKTPAVPCITGWRLRRWFRWFRPGRRCKSSPLKCPSPKIYYFLIWNYTLLK